MRILLINYRYFLSGGPERYMFNVRDLLMQHGHQVIPFSVKSAMNEKTEYEEYFADPIGGSEMAYYEQYGKNAKTISQMLERQFYSFSVRERLERLIDEAEPDVCYLLHHLNKLSPSVIDACRRKGVPIVMRMSDFSHVCPNSYLSRDGKACEECLDGSLLPSVLHRCVKRSAMLSIIKAAAMKFHRMIGVYDHVSSVITPSSFTAEVLERAGIESVQIPTFTDSLPLNNRVGDYALYVGRIEEEKGIMMLVKAMKGLQKRLIIVGKSSTGYDKKIRKEIQGRRNIILAGPKYGNELSKLYWNARFVVVPALWYENMPNVILEAMQHSRPVLASDIGSLREMVRDGHNGFLFKDADDLRSKMQRLFSDGMLCRRLGKNSHQEAEERFSPDQHYRLLYQELNKARRGGK
jgi:glycosyltransferase involved in cell wall biosynthesis